MKGKKYYFILTGILLVGFSAIYFFREQREKQFLEFEAYEIASVEAQVDNLYNEDKTDILEDISTEVFKDIDKLLNDLKVKEYSEKNEQRLDTVEAEFLTAKEMNTLQIDINELFVKNGIIEKDISLDKVETLQKQITRFREKVVYYDRNVMTLSEAEEQIKDIEVARSYIESLFEEELLRSDVTREDEEEALKLIEKIKNEEIREELIARVETVSLALAEAEEALALEEALAAEAAQQELEALEAQEAEQYESSNDSSWSENSSGTWNSSGSSWQPPSNSGSSEGTWFPPPTNSPSQTPGTENNPSELEEPPVDSADEDDENSENEE